MAGSCCPCGEGTGWREDAPAPLSPSHSDAADLVVQGKGTFEELMVCSREIAASTAQLVAASKVGAAAQEAPALPAAPRVVPEQSSVPCALANDPNSAHRDEILILLQNCTSLAARWN